MDVLLEAEDSPFSEVDRLMDNGTKDLCVIKGTSLLLISSLTSFFIAS